MSGNVLELLKIAGLSNQWPTLRPIHDLAMSDLTKASDEAQVELQKRADAAAKAKAEADAKAAAEAKAAADKAQAAQPKAIPAVSNG